MSRKKGGGYVRLLRGKSPDQQKIILRYGERGATLGDVIVFLNEWETLFALHYNRGEKYGEPPVGPFKIFCDVAKDGPADWMQENIRELLGELDRAIQRGDGSFLRQLADAVELRTKPVRDPFRFWIAMVTRPRAPGHKALLGHLTVRQLFDRATEVAGQWGFEEKIQNMDITTFRAILKDLGATYAPDKRGPKKGQRLEH